MPDQSISTIFFLGVLSGLFLLLLIVMRLRFAWIAVTAMLFLSSIGLALTWTNAIHGSWLLPLQIRRSDLFLGLGCLLALASLVHARQLSFQLSSLQAWFLLLIGCYQGVLRGAHESMTNGLFSLGFALATIGTLTLLIPMLLKRQSQLYVAFRVIGAMGIIWFGCVAVQIAVNPSKITIGASGRFVGITANPQHAAAFLAVVATVSVWLIMHDQARRFRVLWMILVGFALIALIGTGSRTGILMFVLGVTAILWRRFGRMALTIPFAAISVWMIYKVTLWLGLELPFSRVLSVEDTRSRIWNYLFTTMLENPVLGIGMAESGSENSFLFGGAAFGLGMFLIMLLFMLYSMLHCLNLVRWGRHHPQIGHFIDLLIGFNMMYFAGAMFEGYILARATHMLMFMLIFGSVSAILLRAMRTDDPDILYQEQYQRTPESVQIHEDHETYYPPLAY